MIRLGKKTLFVLSVLSLGCSWAAPPRPTRTKAPAPAPAVTMESAAVSAQNLRYRIETSKLTLRMTHSKLGRFDTDARNGLSGDLELVEGKWLRASRLDFRVAKFSSLIGLRDEHIKNKYLEAERFPTISLLDLKAPLPARLEPFSGRLWVKGVEGPLQNARARSWIEDERLRVVAEFQASITSFKIPPPFFKGLGVEDTFQVLVDLTALPELADEATP